MGWAVVIGHILGFQFSKSCFLLKGRSPEQAIRDPAKWLLPIGLSDGAVDVEMVAMQGAGGQDVSAVPRFASRSGAELIAQTIRMKVGQGSGRASGRVRGADQIRRVQELLGEPTKVKVCVLVEPVRPWRLEFERSAKIGADAERITILVVHARQFEGQSQSLQVLSAAFGICSFGGLWVPTRGEPSRQPTIGLGSEQNRSVD
jgi:hypothetical protein